MIDAINVVNEKQSTESCRFMKKTMPTITVPTAPIPVHLRD